MVGCTKRPIVYSPNDFKKVNRVITQKQAVRLPHVKVNASYGMGNDPAVVKAYNRFIKRGVAKNVGANGFKTLAYQTYTHPIVDCAPLHLCVLQLEGNEKINNIDLGDSAHWMVSTSLVGGKQNGSYQIVLKPKKYDIATDMVIATNKRTYNVGLVSKKGATTHLVNFYYPEETLNHALSDLHQQQVVTTKQAVVATASALSVDKLNFNYRLSGDSPAWRPVRIFDDGQKTYIQMPQVASKLDLPVLYLLKDGQAELVNYRYKQPYYLIDGLFKSAYLVSGKGHQQVRVVIQNKHFA